LTDRFELNEPDKWTGNINSKLNGYLVACAAALAVLEQGLVAARRHGHERVLVGVLEPARATWRTPIGASTTTQCQPPSHGINGKTEMSARQHW